MPLHLTKVAYGAQSMDDLRGWFADRADGTALLTTRNLPKRADEVVAGGSLYWILRHQLVARSRIIRFEPAEGGRNHIVIATDLVEVHPVPRRAHQGWRYLEQADAPKDLADGEVAGDTMPAELASNLARLGLV